MSESITRPTIAKISLDNLSHNFNYIKSKVGAVDIMSAIKANAYGHGLIEVAKHLESIGTNSLAVGFLEEAIELKKAGITIPIVILGGMLDFQLAQAVENKFELTISSIEQLNFLDSVARDLNLKAVIHLKIDTGMNRNGVNLNDAKALIEKALLLKNVYFKGIYSHLACADDPNHSMNKLQLERFDVVLKDLENFQVDHKVIRHLANSAGVMYHPDTYFDCVRPGIMLYGAHPCSKFSEQHDLKPVLSLVSKINHIKQIQAGEVVSYGATWQANTTCNIASVPIGYGDGWSRKLSNAGNVLYNGKRYPIIGVICMDQLLINLGEDQAQIGDQITLIGHDQEKITAEEIAEQLGTISYEVLSNLNNRIPREYI